MRQCVNDGDVGVDLDGQTIQDGRVVAPLADGGKGGLDQEGIAGNHFQGLNGAVGGDYGSKFNTTFMAKLPGERRIDWFDPMIEHGRLNGADVDARFC